MATHLDLEEQEQLDQIKHFWKQYGNLIVWVLIIALGGFAAWNYWLRWQSSRAVQAAAMYDAIDQAAQAGDADHAAALFENLKQSYPKTAFAQQGGLLLAKTQFDKGQADKALATLGWVREHAEGEYDDVARLRIAGLLLDQKKYDEALKQLDGLDATAFAGLAADRRGDILMAQGKKDDARQAYRKAWDAMEADVNYRRLVEAKLAALGAAPTPAPAAVSASAAVSGASQ